MQETYNAPNRMYSLINAANQFIDNFMKLSPNNRIGVVVYDSTASVLLPLDHYTPATSASDGKPAQYLTAEKHHWQAAYRQWASTVSSVSTSTTKNQLVNNSVTSWSNTDTMAAIDGALAELVKAQDLSVGGVVRQPVMVLMADGAANTVLTTSSGQGNQWTNLPSVSTSTNSSGNLNGWDGLGLGNVNGSNSNFTMRTYNTVTGNSAANFENIADQTSANLTTYGNKDGHLMGAGNSIVLFNTLMNAAYMKSAVENHYNKDLKDGETPRTAQIYTIGYDVGAYTGETGAFCNAILNPTNSFNAGTGQQVITEDYNRFQSFLNGQTITL